MVVFRYVCFQGVHLQIFDDKLFWWLFPKPCWSVNSLGNVRWKGHDNDRFCIDDYYKFMSIWCSVKLQVYLEFMVIKLIAILWMSIGWWHSKHNYQHNNINSGGIYDRIITRAKVSSYKHTRDRNLHEKITTPLLRYRKLWAYFWSTCERLEDFLYIFLSFKFESWWEMCNIYIFFTSWMKHLDLQNICYYGQGAF